MSIPGKAEYERSERAQFHTDLRRAERGSPAEVKEAAREFLGHMREDPELIGERIGWLLDGNYGYGSYATAQEIIKNKRMNREAWLLQTVAALEWMVPQRYAIAAWKKLSSTEKEKLSSAIKREIKSANESETDRDRPRRRRVRPATRARTTVRRRRRLR